MGRNARDNKKPEPIKAAMTQDVYDRFMYVWENDRLASQVTRQDFAALLISLGLQVWEQKWERPPSDDDTKKENSDHENAQ